MPITWKCEPSSSAFQSNEYSASKVTGSAPRATRFASDMASADRLVASTSFRVSRRYRHVMKESTAVAAAVMSAAHAAASRPANVLLIGQA